MTVIAMSHGKLRSLWWMHAIRNILPINYNIVLKSCSNLSSNILAVPLVIKGHVILSGCFSSFSANKKSWRDLSELLE